MISNESKDLLFIEPTQPASSTPVLDEMTRRMTAALRAATPGPNAWLGIHECICGAGSTNHNYILPDGRTTNSLCVHYLAYHRAEVPVDQLREIAQLNCGALEPNRWELVGTRPVGWGEPDGEQPQRRREHWALSDPRLKSDREFYELLGPERQDEPCRRQNCGRGRISHSIFCRAHHFEHLLGRSCPFSD